MRVASRLSLMAGGTIIVILVMGITSFISVSNLIKANDWVSHTRQVLQELNLLLYNLSDTISTQRTYIITSQPAYLNAYRERAASTMETLSEVERLVLDSPEQAERAAKLRTLIQERLASLEITTNLYQQKGAAAAFDRVRTGKSLQFRIALHKAIDEMKNHEVNLLQRRDKDMRHSAASSEMTITAGACLGLVSLTLFSLLFARYILSCIKQLIRASDNIRYGRFDLAVHTNSNDEFSELAAAFNTVGHQLLVVSKKLAEQEKEIKTSTQSAEHLNQELIDLRNRLTAAAEALAQNEMTLQEQDKNISEIAEVFDKLDELSHQLESTTANNYQLIHRISASRERAEENAASLKNSLSAASRSYEGKVNELSDISSEMSRLQESVKSFENLIANLDLISMTANLEQVRSASTDSTSAILLERLKGIVEEAKHDKGEFSKSVSEIRSLAERTLNSIHSATATISDKTLVADRIYSELSKQADLYIELKDSGMDAIIQNNNKLLKSKRPLLGKLSQNIKSNQAYLESIGKVFNQPLKETKTDFLEKIRNITNS